MGWSARMLVLLMGVLVIDMAIGFVIEVLLERADGELIDLPRLHPSDGTLAQQALSLVLLAPLVEEALFRGWLTGRKASLRFAAWGIVAFAVVLAGELPALQDYVPFIITTGFALAGIGFVQWLLTYRKDAGVPAWFSNNMRWFVWGSAICFGLFHLGNYEGVTQPQHLLVVLPAIVGGLLLAYSRIRFGLRAAMLHHALYNGLFLLAEQLGR